jgi:uncharacterized DUF497 family protein
MYEWDEPKRLATIDKHGIDFIDAIEIFEAKHLVLDARSDIETRKIAVGVVGAISIAVVYTVRDDVIRIITARKARKNERLCYEALLAGRDPADERQN